VVAPAVPPTQTVLGPYKALQLAHRPALTWISGMIRLVKQNTAAGAGVGGRSNGSRINGTEAELPASLLLGLKYIRGSACGLPHRFQLR
jgi:hypothetical protein